MSVDYDGVGGIGIQLTDEMVEYAIDKGVFTEEDWDDDWDDCLSKMDGFVYSVAGSAWSGDICTYLFVPGLTLGKINLNSFRFIEKIKEYFGVDIAIGDLKVVKDIYIY